MMELHGYFRSSSSYRCRIALNLKQINYDFHPVHLVRDGGEQHSPAFRALNPQGLVPALVDGEFVLSQSLAILEWLDETHPEPPLLPANPDERAQVRAFALAIACEIHPLQNLRVLKYLKKECGQEQTGVDAWCQRWISEGLAACEMMLANNRNEGPFCFGEQPGLADICLVPQVFSAHRFGVALDAMPHVVAVAEACETLPEFADAHPSKQLDFEP